MRVLHVVPVLASRFGGPAVHVVECSLAARTVGVEGSIIATDLAAPPSRHRRVVTAEAELPRGVEEINVRLCKSSWPYRFAYSRELRQVLAQEAERADLIRIHSLFLYPQYAAYREAVRTGVPYIVSFHGAMDPYLRRRGRTRKWLTHVAWQSDMLKRASAIHVTSAEERRLTADVAPDVPRVLIPNGIYWNQFQNLPHGWGFRRRKLDGHRGPIVLSLGRIARKKAPDRLVRALPEVVRHHPDVLLVFAGPDDEGLMVGLLELAQSLGVERRVRFTGMVHREERLQALSAATIWALPSHTENFAVAAAEALAAGVPVVLTPQVNIAAAAAAAGAAIVLRPDGADLSRRLVQLLDDGALRATLGARAREHARQFDWGTIAPQLYRIYRDISGKGEIRDVAA